MRDSTNLSAQVLNRSTAGGACCLIAKNSTGGLMGSGKAADELGGKFLLRALTGEEA